MFRVGQKVVCVDDKFQRQIEEKYPIKGEIYTVRASIFHERANKPAILLEEIVNPILEYRFGYNELWFIASRFRPVTYISDSEFEELEKELNKEEYAKI